MNKMNKIIKLLTAAIFAFSFFSFTACDDVEEVELVSGLQQIAVTREPDKLKYCKTDTELDTTGIIVTATYRSGATKIIPVEELDFKGFRSDAGVLSGGDVITVTYTDSTGTIRQAKYQITYTEIAGISIVQSPVTSYKLNSESVEGMIGGIGQKGVNRKGSDQSLSDIADWHFNCEGLKLAVNYVNGDKRFLTFKNGAGSYGTGTSDTKPYVYDNDGNLKYIQRWSEEKDGNNDSYKIRITGFDPIASFKTTENLSGSQVVTIYYTEDGKTETAQLQLNYDFTSAYKKTETIVKITEDGIPMILLGDYPQSEKEEGVVINKAKTQNGLFNYQTGSDGNLYVQKVWEKAAKYYKVEPIKWSIVPGYGSTNHYYYFQSEKILHSGIPYYSGTSERKASKQDTFQFSENNVKCAGNVNYTYDISKASFCYSTVRNFLNGDSANNDNTYNGKGFLQTAFTPAVIEEKLKNIPLHEFFDSRVAISGTVADSSGTSTSNVSAETDGFTYESYYSLKVMIPFDHSDSSLGVVRRYFCNTGSLSSGNFASRLDTGEKGNAIIKTWVTAHYCENSSFDLDYGNGSTTDFTSDVQYYWRASDVTTAPDGIPGRGKLSSEGTVVHETYSGSENQNGIAPIILLEYFE